MSDKDVTVNIFNTKSFNLWWWAPVEYKAIPCGPFASMRLAENHAMACHGHPVNAIVTEHQSGSTKLPFGDPGITLDEVA